jgi:uncharacterized membrane protein
MADRLRFYLSRLRERLWIRPLGMCMLSMAAVFIVKAVDTYDLGQFVPEISQASIETLLSIISTSMLVIATFSVSSMVAAYACASNTATPRSFALVVADDLSQYALSTFIGAFIFSVVALIALENSYYDKAGRFALFTLTLIILAMVVVMFVRWVDSIARLGRIKDTIDKVEQATAAAIRCRRREPTLSGAPVSQQANESQAIYAKPIGYVQQVDVAALRACAEQLQVRITLTALPGTFSAPGRALAFVRADAGDLCDIDTTQMAKAFMIGDDRKFEGDPRFGLIVLSEIAIRALSPAVNDPGTAIYIIGVFVRLFALWSEPVDEDDIQTNECDRVEVPQISIRDMFDDAFTSIARDGAGAIEVAVRLQKAFESLASIHDAAMQDAAIHHSRMAFARAVNALKLSEDQQLVRKLASFTHDL